MHRWRGRQSLGMWVLAVLLCAAMAPATGAQGVRGVVRDSASRIPVVGAVVLLLGQRGDTLARALTDLGGGFAFAPPAAGGTARSVRVLRIGYAPRDRSLTARDGAAMEIALRRLPTLIQAVNIRAPARCPRRGDRAVAFGLWEQARAALLASVVAREAMPSDKRRIRFEQLMEGNSDRVQRHAVRVTSGIDRGNSFFAARTAGEFASRGFTEFDEEGDTRYFGPDAEVLLDASFAVHYCLAVARAPKGRETEVGLAFVPADPYRVSVDVEGVVWIDTLRRALSRVDFEYTGMTGAAARAQPGGSLSYLELPSGIVLVDHWEFNLVGNQVDTVNADGEVRYTPRLQRSRVGGQLAQVHWPDGTTWRAALGEISGVARRRDGAPAAGVGILLEHTNYGTKVDSMGMFAIPDLVPGPYRVLIEEPRLASLDLLVPTTFRFEVAGDSTLRTTLVLPTVEDLVRERCVAAVASSASATGFFLGRLLRPDGGPAADIEIVLQAQAASGGGLVRRHRVRTALDGTFQWCDNRLQSGSRLTLEVPQDSGDPLRVEHTLTSHLTVMRIGLP